MSAILAGAILGGASVLSGLASQIYSAYSQNKANKANLEFSKEQFEYQKYLNNNQYQLQASDAQKAGINPIAMQGGSLSSGSFSAGQQSVDTSALSGVSSSLGNIASTILSNKNARQISDDSNNTSLSIARLQTQSQEEQNKLKLETEERIERARLEAQKELQQQKILSDEGISSRELSAKVEQWKIENSYKARELSKRLESFDIENYSASWDLYQRIFYGKEKTGQFDFIINAFKNVLGDTLVRTGGIPTFMQFRDMLKTLKDN